MSSERTSGSQPPDGGWGWMIVCGSALSQLFLIPIIQNFTLVFKERFLELGFSSTDITTLVSLNISFGMILGIINGPILKIFGYRKLALTGGTFYVIGNLLTGIAKSYIEFIIYYGMLTSMGLNMTMASFSLALNSYFHKKRSKAVSYTMVLTGFGPILLPLLISYLLSIYGVKWTVFILSGLALHIYVAALLLQPVKWHMKIPTSADSGNMQQEKPVLLPDAHSLLDIAICGSSNRSPGDFDRKFSISNVEKERKFSRLENRIVASRETVNGDFSAGKLISGEMNTLSLTHLDNDDYKNMMKSTLCMVEKAEGEKMKYASVETLKLSNDSDDEWNYKAQATEPLNSKALLTENGNVRSRISASEDPGIILRLLYFLRDIYDVDLLRSFTFINMIFGLSIALVGELSFSTLTPFILREIGFDTQDSAMFLSIIASSDLVSRLAGPYVAKALHLTSKGMYLLALFLLLLSRTSLYLASTYETYIIISFALGIAKGFRSVFWVLVIPDNVPLKKLPSASAFQSLLNGLLIITSGPIIGAVIAINNKYTNLIIVSNTLTLVTICLWCGEWIILKCRRQKILRQSLIS